MAEGLNQEIIQLLNKELTDYRPQQIDPAFQANAHGNQT